MGKGKLLQAVGTIAFVTGLAAAAGAIFPLFDYLWSTFVSGNDVLTKAWINESITKVISSSCFGLMFSIGILWSSRKKYPQEPMTENPIPVKKTRAEWLLYIYPIILGFVPTVISSWIVYEEILIKGSRIYSYLAGLGSGPIKSLYDSAVR